MDETRRKQLDGMMYTELDCGCLAYEYDDVGSRGIRLELCRTHLDITELQTENARLREVLEMASNTIQTTMHFMPEVGNGAHLETLKKIQALQRKDGDDL